MRPVPPTTPGPASGSSGSQSGSPHRLIPTPTLTSPPHPPLPPLRRDLSNTSGIGMSAIRPPDESSSDIQRSPRRRPSEHSSVRVVVRCRPMNATERARQDPHLFRFSSRREMQVVTTPQIVSNTIVPPTSSASGAALPTASNALTSATRELVRSYAFDYCASEELTQSQFFRSCGVATLLESVIEGYVATVFAYGQTGSGKTYSMSGIDELIPTARKNAPNSDPHMKSYGVDDQAESDGIIPRALEYLFTLFQRAKQSHRVRFVIRASYCEIYNEQVYDLLNPPKVTPSSQSSNGFGSGPASNNGAAASLHVRWNDRSGFYIQNLLVVQCDNLDDLMAVVQEGHKNRRVGTHAMNKDSSRSHSIMTIHIDRHEDDSPVEDGEEEEEEEVPAKPTTTRQPTTKPGKTTVKYGKISFVDLAGSERLKETKSSNTEETSNINKSLLTLGKVISALAAASSKVNSLTSPYIPYRDSKLTKLLMDSLGGNALTLMIACVSPSASSLDDTLSTLNYATRAKNIQNKPTVQVDATEFALVSLRKENKLLRAENHELKARLRAATEGSTSVYDARSEDTQWSSPPSSSRVVLPPILPESSQFLPTSAQHKRVGMSHNHSNVHPSASISPSKQSLDAYKNQLLALQDENDKLMKHTTIADQRVRHFKAENEALQAKLATFSHHAKSPRVLSDIPESPTKSIALMQQLKHQVQQLQQREQELMQALARRSRGNIGIR